MFAATLTMSLKYILNPDKKALPWRRYCTADYPTLYSLQNLVNPDDLSSSATLQLAPLGPSNKAWPYPGMTQRPFDPSAQADIPLAPVGVFLGVFTMDSGVLRRNLVRDSYGSHWRSRRNGTECVSVRFIMGTPRLEYVDAVERENQGKLEAGI